MQMRAEGYLKTICVHLRAPTVAILDSEEATISRKFKESKHSSHKTN